MEGITEDLLEVDYSTHLLVMAVMNASSTEIVKRIQTLIKLETKEYYRQQNIEFSMDKTYTTLTVSADVEFHPFIDLGVFNDGASWIFTKRLKQSVSY